MVFSFDNLGFAYEGGERLFSSLSLSAVNGERILIIGRPGVGKTTLAKVLTGAAPKYFPGTLEGSVLLDGKDLLSLDIPMRSRFISRTSQNTDSMLLFSTAEDELAFPMENEMVEPAVMKDRVSDLLEKWELEKYRDSDSSLLSGGEKRRLSLAVSDAVSSPVRIYDEPFDELSHEWRVHLRNLLEKSDGIVIVLASHYIEEYEGLFTRMFEMTASGLIPYKAEPPELKIVRASRIDLPHELVVRNILFHQSQKASSTAVDFTLSAKSLSLASGELVLLKGDNGSGKSTLSRIITGLRKEERGSVELDGRPLRDKERKRCISYLSQNPYNQLFLPTVLDEAMTTTRDMDRIESAMALFGFKGDEYVEELSHGKAKLVQALVFYLLDRPFAIFDELDTALSYEEAASTLSLFLSKGAGVILISHDDRMLSVADRVYHIAGGTLYD